MFRLMLVGIRSTIGTRGADHVQSELGRSPLPIRGGNMRDDAFHSTLQQFTRRNCLRVGGLGALGLSLPQWLSAGETETNTKRTAKSCSLLFL